MASGSTSGKGGAEPALARARAAGVRNEWISRFATYFIGVAIGLMLVGLLYMARQKMVRPAGSGPETPAEMMERAMRGPRGGSGSAAEGVRDVGGGGAGGAPGVK